MQTLPSGAKWSNPPAPALTDPKGITSLQGGRGAWIALVITLAIQALVAMAVFTVPAMAPAVAARLEVSPSLVGGYVAVVYLGATISSLVSGPLVLRFGAVRVSQWGLVACALGLVLTSVASGAVGAALAAFVTGLGYGPITPASSHLLARSTPPSRVSLVFSVKQTGVPLGGVLAGALVPPIAVANGVQVALWAVCAGCLLCAALAQALRREFDADRQPGEAIGFADLGGPLRLVLGHPELRRLAAVSFVFSAIQMCLAAYLVTYLTAELDHSLVAAGVALSVAQVGGVVGRVLWGWVADRWIRPAVMLASLALLMALCSAALAAMAVETPAKLVLALLAVFGASATGWNGVYLAEVARQAPAGLAGTATGGSLAFTFVGVVLGPLLFGGVSGLSETYRAGFAALALPALVCAVALARGFRR